MNRALYRSERCYRALLYLYPSEMRRAFGRDMAELFRDRCRQEIRNGRRMGLALAQVWKRAFFDVLRSASMERFDALTRMAKCWTRSGMSSTRSRSDGTKTGTTLSR